MNNHLVLSIIYNFQKSDTSYVRFFLCFDPLCNGVVAGEGPKASLAPSAFVYVHVHAPAKKVSRYACVDAH